MQKDEDDEQKRKEQPGESKTSPTTTKKKNTQHQSNPIDDGCSVCLIPVRFTLNATIVLFQQLTNHHKHSLFTGPRTIAFLD